MMLDSFKPAYHREPGTSQRPRRDSRPSRRRDRRPGVETVESRILLAGSWIPVAEPAPGGVETMLLLTDGRVMAQIGSTDAWYALKPNTRGSYVRGTWSRLASMHDTRLYYASAVLPSGNVFVAGGEIGTGGNSVETYDPVTDQWASVQSPDDANLPDPPRKIGDAPSKLLPDGDILLAPEERSPNFPTVQTTLIFQPSIGTWDQGPSLYKDPGAQNTRSANEENWVLMPDGSILAVDNDSTGTPGAYPSERYLPTTNQWANDATVPVDLWYKNPQGENDTGPGVLLDDGRAFFLGASGHTAIYTPAAHVDQSGTWAAGPDIPDGLGSYDGSAVVLSNGKVLCAVGPKTGNGPTTFVEYDPVANQFTVVPCQPNDASQPFTSRFLALPDGNALFADGTNQLYIYKPGGRPRASWRPTITKIRRNLDGSFHLTGTQLNGLNEGAYYGDDAQMSSNYPIVRLSNASHHVYYARTTNWTIGVATGRRSVSTDFTLPRRLPAGNYQLSVVANGIASRPVSFHYHP
jgi:hypothetical protein